jgi:hypothetical protein
MIRRNPEALAIALILLLIPVASFVGSLHERLVRHAIPIHRELRIQRDNFRMEGQRLRLNREQLRREFRENIRNAFRFDCI